MTVITFGQLSNPVGIFDRAALMPRPLRRAPSGGCPSLTLTQRKVWAAIHPQLPPTALWAYDNRVPGPVVVVRSGQKVTVRHRNRISGTMPYGTG
jgi:hypothetical protein